MIRSVDTLIVGAGLSGLLAARRLVDAGHDCLIVDKGRGPGGRMASRRIGDAVLDHGAQFFTVRYSEFAVEVEHWVSAGVATPWCSGFSPDLQDGHTRYRGAPSMNSIPKWLAAEVQVECGTTVGRIIKSGRGWKVETTDSEVLEANRIILTAPVPQSLALLDAGGSLPIRDRDTLDAISYHRCIALLAVFTDQVSLPFPGAIQQKSVAIQWVCDNVVKGVSAGGSSVTIHASPATSLALWDESEEVVVRTLLDEVRDLVDSAPQSVQLHKWRYSQPVANYPQRCLVGDEEGTLIFAGDAFGGSRVEGAALSGFDAARVVLERNAHD